MQITIAIIPTTFESTKVSRVRALAVFEHKLLDVHRSISCLSRNDAEVIRELYR